MEIYKGNLRFIKTTKKMVVYGDENLPAQYVPKAMLERHGRKDYPDFVVFTLSLPTGDTPDAESPINRPVKHKHRPA